MMNVPTQIYGIYIGHGDSVGEYELSLEVFNEQMCTFYIH